MQHELLNYRVFGNGHPVVFLHGFMESISMWQFIDFEEMPFQSVLIDLPGHGASELWDEMEIPSLEFMADQVKMVIEKLNLNQYDLVGHSMGGYIAMVLKKNDANCRKVVLLNSTFKEDSAQKKKDRVRVADLALKSKNLFIQEAIPGLFYRFSREDKIVQQLVEEAKKMKGESIAYSALAMRERKNTFELFDQYPNQLFVVQGENDPLIDCSTMIADLKLYPNQLFVMKNVGHMSQFENPEATNQLLKNVLT